MAGMSCSAMMHPSSMIPPAIKLEKWQMIGGIASKMMHPSSLLPPPALAPVSATPVIYTNIS